MKTNKEIKPFKMRCENTDELLEARSILMKLGYAESSFVVSGETLLIYQEPNLIITAFDCMGAFNSYPSPELTYSEFMKLYGDKEEVFTREDMKEFAYYYGRRSKSFSVEHHLTNFLSERTND